MKHSLLDLSSDILLKSVNILLLSLAGSSFSSMRGINEEQLAGVVVTTDVPRLEDEHTDIGCVKLFRTNSDIEDVVVESVDTTTVSGVEEIETTLMGCLELFGTMAEIVEAEDDTDISCVTSVESEVEVEDFEDDSSVDVEEPQLVLDSFLGLDSPCRGGETLLRATCLIAETIELSFPKDPRGTYPVPNLDRYRQRPLAQS